MENALSPSRMASSPPPNPLERRDISPFYYSLLAIASTALLLVAYNIIVVRWCWQHHRNRNGLNRRGGLQNPSQHGIPSYKYKKKDEAASEALDHECSVCLSGFVDGEDVRQLPKCKHLFHADCIDMWLYSHSNCPLCRADVAVPPSLRGRPAAASDENDEHSREDLLGYNSMV